MTTGRINQVTTFLKLPSNYAEATTVTTSLHQNGASFRNWEFSLEDCIDSTATLSTFPHCVLVAQKASGRNTLFPDLTNFEHTSPGHN